jgi:hypothetical protein
MHLWRERKKKKKKKRKKQEKKTPRKSIANFRQEIKATQGLQTRTKVSRPKSNRALIYTTDPGLKLKNMEIITKTTNFFNEMEC